MRCFSIVQNWPLTINPLTFLTLYPQNSIWMDDMTLHCTKLTLDHQPLYILDPLPLKQHLNGWDDSPLQNIKPWPLNPSHYGPFTLKTIIEWMRWFSMVQNWPLTINTFTFLTLYPENSIWMEDMFLHCTLDNCTLYIVHCPLYKIDPWPLTP